MADVRLPASWPSGNRVRWCPVERAETTLANQEARMTKLKLLAATTISIALGGAIAIQMIHPASTPAAAHQSQVAFLTTSAKDRAADKTKIVPAPVIDHESSFFVGTGDGSAGVWARP
jgi:hypothetical protein